MNSTIARAGQTTQPFAIGIGALVTISPSQTGTGYVEYSTSSANDVQYGLGTWSTWALGEVSAISSDISGIAMFVRLVCSAGNMSLSTGDGYIENFVENESAPWKSQVVSIPDLSNATDPAKGAALVARVAYSPIAGSKSLGMLGCAVRHDGSTLILIDDSSHLPVGITSVDIVDTYTFRVNYDHDFSQVGTLIASLDNDLAPYGIHIGASVGTDSATFVMYAPLIFSANGAGTITSIAPFWGSVVSLNTAGASSVIFNKPAGLNTNGPGVTTITNSTSAPLSTTWASTTVTVAAMSVKGAGGGRVDYTAGDFVLSGASVSGMSVATSGNACVITHPAIGARGDRSVTGGNISLIPQFATYGDTTTTVQFRKMLDGSIATIALDSADMKFNFILNGLTPSATLSATTAFTIDCGLCKVAIAQIAAVALNNFWLSGFMNK